MLTLLAGFAFCISIFAQPIISTTAGLQQRIQSTEITANGDEWDIDGVIGFDNGDSNSYRVWWGFTVNNLETNNGEILNYHPENSLILSKADSNCKMFIPPTAILKKFLWLFPDTSPGIQSNFFLFINFSHIKNESILKSCLI